MVPARAIDCALEIQAQKPLAVYLLQADRRQPFQAPKLRQLKAFRKGSLHSGSHNFKGALVTGGAS
jgi:hypothetical protein